MADTVIDNPILNRPYDEPLRHFEFDTDGITDKIAESRRPSSYFIPIPQSRKGGRQLELAELTADQIQLNPTSSRPPCARCTAPTSAGSTRGSRVRARAAPRRC